MSDKVLEKLVKLSEKAEENKVVAAIEAALKKGR
jgi:hypothetical protein